MRHINLYQAEFRPARVLLPARHILLLALAWLLLLGAAYAWQQARYQGLRADASAAKARADALIRQAAPLRRPPPQADARLLAEAESWERRVQALQQAQDALARGAAGSEAGHAARFRALAHARTPDAWLTRIEISDAGREMNLTGRALHGEDPAKLIAGLRRQPLFAGLHYAALEIETPPEPAAPAAKGDKAAPPAHLEFSLRARREEKSATVPAAAPLAAPGAAALSLLPNPPHAQPAPQPGARP